jgi:hypothetical protein
MTQSELRSKYRDLSPEEQRKFVRWLEVNVLVDDPPAAAAKPARAVGKIQMRSKNGSTASTARRLRLLRALYCRIKRANALKIK